MPKVAIRLLLALCLVLNGIGDAIAAAAMPAMLGGSHHAVMPMTDAAPAARACDHGVDARGLAEDPPVPPAPAATHPSDCDQACCAQGACSCPCMQVVQAALLDMPVLPSVSGRAQMVAVLSPGHLAPVPLELIRPPIG